MENASQQFCLRWHNHQTSLLSSLPLLLDQSHLTDVTLSAEGKTLRAHRVVLSACSTFFSELFRTLDATFHPVIVIPGASFNTVIALLTFMYSGEVNVFEEQISALLALAETLGVKGLADLHNNNNLCKSPKDNIDNHKDNVSSITTKLPTPLENFFIKSFQFYPNLIPQPLNFSQSALNKSNEFLTKCQNNFGLSNLQKDNDDLSIDDEIIKCNDFTDKKLARDAKKIDKIAENLRSATISKPLVNTITGKSIETHSSNSSLLLKPQQFSAQSTHHFINEETTKSGEILSTDPITTNYPIAENLTTTESILEKTITAGPTKTSNSKLYATCFICHKQLSNQYNLRVHLETHQNVRYACNVCSHVSRSKDALRKHVSYRHPGAPSPCESETRRKRSKIAANSPFQAMKQEFNDVPGTNNFSNQSIVFLQNQMNLSTGNSSQNAGKITPTTSLIQQECCIKNDKTISERPEST